MSDFRFASPDWSACLWGVLAVTGALLWLEQRRGDALAKFVSPLMQPRLVSRPPMWRRLIALVLLGTAAVCFVVALMRPQFGLTYVKSPRVGAQIMFCLDVSKSMLAEDVAPNRLDRAKADITDLLTFLDGDQVGLIGFAGRASVLCPLTPDYGFFKLILDGAGPNSVGRGGTSLEEPLRKALDGFRSESDVSRVVFLITDGEDHDSHPLDVAEDAVERGIKVVAVGLGDEAGSEIEITDPRTGVRSQVLDADNRPVVTRLDGETLRELALATEGVYIPAGTGSLDLKSIYEAHIRPLVRGEMQAEGRAIRRDAFQWAILAGLIFLIAYLLISNSNVADSDAIEEQPQMRIGSRAALLFWLALFVPHATALADPTVPEVTDAAKSDADPQQQLDAREIYNLGLGRLDDDLDAAERFLMDARSKSASDGEVRFRATFNMGWVEVNRANALLEGEPQQALEHLQRAAGWFRDCVRLRGDADDARHNLEVVLLRITQLRDQLLKQDEQDLATELDQLIESERQIIAKLRGLVDQVSRKEDPNIADEFRTQFQRLAVDQRVALSDLQGLVERTGGELETLQSKNESDRKPEEGIRIAQLSGVLNDLNQSSQRLGQTRSQLRRRQALRGFRRAATGLIQLKRARDHLREPLELLDGIVQDLTATAQQTATKSLESQFVGSGETTPKIPAWIDQEFLADSQSDLTTRTEQLADRLAAGLEHSDRSEPATDPQNTAGKSDAVEGTKPDELTPEQQEFLQQIRRAMPYLVAATESQKTAGEKISLAEFGAASEQQIVALKALRLAREQFADLRTLIELAYADQREITAALSAVVGDDDSPRDNDSEPTPEENQIVNNQIAQYVAQRQADNLERMERLRREIASGLAKAESAGNDATDPGTGDDQQPSTEIQRFNLATELADRALEQMNAVSANLPTDSKRADEQETKTGDSVGEDSGDSQTLHPFERSNDQSGAAVASLEELRRLFFSIVEHLQETARRQAGLNDETEQMAAIQTESPDSLDQSRKDVGPLAAQQQELAQTANQIATALEEQSNAADESSDSGEPTDEQQQALMRQNAEQAKKASALVAEAETEMINAADSLSLDEPDLAKARPPQDTALEKLIEALRELQPPQDNQSNQDQQQQDQQQQQSGSEDQQDQQDQQQQEQDSQMDPSRVLQAVRDREAQRRRDQEKRQHAGQVPVEKDW